MLGVGFTLNEDKLLLVSSKDVMPCTPLSRQPKFVSIRTRWIPQRLVKNHLVGRVSDNAHEPLGASPTGIIFCAVTTLRLHYCMIFPRSTKHTVLCAFAALAMLLRVAIPTGFMPSNVDDGWFVQLCPEGMPTHVIVALFGEHHLHHGEDEEDTFFQCNYDSGVVGYALLDSDYHTCAELAGGNVVATIAESSIPRTPVLGYLSRAPPNTSV